VIRLGVIVLAVAILILFIEGLVKIMAFPLAIAIVCFVLYKIMQHKNSR
jgi:hypothetical protein